MTAAKYNIVIEQGATYSTDVLVKDLNGNTVDLTSYTLRMDVKDQPGGTKLASSYGTSPKIVLTKTGTTGHFTINLTETVTAALTPGVYKYDIEIELSSTVTRIMEGDFIVKAEVTV